MTVRGFQTWLTIDKNISAITLTPFVIGAGIRHEAKRQVGIMDIVFLGFGLTFEWELKPKSPFAPTTKGAT